MPTSYSNIMVHIIFSTKNRVNAIPESIAQEIHAYIGGIGRKLECPVLAVGGTQDHVHVVASLTRTMAVSELVQKIKSGSSSWMKTKGPDRVDFAWQVGYGVFSIGQSQLDRAVRYIAGQVEHHKKTTFKEEFLAFLEKYNVEYDPQWLWN
jgi:REP-associated tyrosine transposase